jgi:hypothetical protein
VISTNRFDSFINEVAVEEDEEEEEEEEKHKTSEIEYDER